MELHMRNKDYEAEAYLECVCFDHDTNTIIVPDTFGKVFDGKDFFIRYCYGINQACLIIKRVICETDYFRELQNASGQLAYYNMELFASKALIAKLKFRIG